MFLLLFPLSLVTAAQGGREERPEVDPYTEGERENLARAGYVRFGPFELLPDGTTEMVTRDVGQVPLLWVETPHFKLGCSLDGLSAPRERAARERFAAELDELRERVPGIGKRVKELDPWLLLHLYAWRLERLYARFSALLDLGEGEPGPGEYLGMKGKFIVLLVEKESTLSRLGTRFAGLEARSTLMHHVPESDSMVFAIAMESLAGDLYTDATLHFALVFNLVETFTNALRGYWFRAPLWWRHGLARWLAREVDETVLLYTSQDGQPLRSGEDSWRFEPKVRARVAQGYFPKMEELVSWTDASALKFSDHMMMWSRVDFIVSLGPERAGAFARALKAPVDALPDRDEVIARQLVEALPEALGLDLAAFDAAWVEYVLENYPKR